MGTGSRLSTRGTQRIPLYHAGPLGPRLGWKESSLALTAWYMCKVGAFVLWPHLLDTWRVVHAEQNPCSECWDSWETAEHKDSVALPHHGHKVPHKLVVGTMEEVHVHVLYQYRKTLPVAATPKSQTHTQWRSNCGNGRFCKGAADHAALACRAF